MPADDKTKQTTRMEPDAQTGNRTCWVITDDRAGTIAQAIGLAEAVGFPFEHKQIVLRQPWRSLPPALWPAGIFGLNAAESAALTPPWPDLVISCGRKAIGPALAVKRASGGKTKAVHIQHPHMPLGRFDLVAVPGHDNLSGPNVIVTTGAIHRVSRTKLEDARHQFAGRFDHLPRPLIAVLIGGSNKAFTMTRAIAERMAADITHLADRLGASLLITASRRTGAENEAILRNAMTGSNVYFWDGSGENPYFGFLALADAILVTGDSVNMVSEAASSGKPVFIIPLETAPGAERAAGKFERFRHQMIDQGAARMFDERVEIDAPAAPLDETARVAAAVKALFP
ncbi:mitochondrial fission ELM1 family protein [Hwanghaeella sp.]|uniref:mitochondrial fission ELM1 family protein n=1 Tax=Hwanghaeella sp. TaxID=2605943 RepID=UPI003CCC2CF0